MDTINKGNRLKARTIVILLIPKPNIWFIIFYVFCMYFYITGLSEGWKTPRIDYLYQYFSYFLIIFFLHFITWYEL